MQYICPVTMYLFAQQVFYYDYKYYVHRLYCKYDMYTLTSLKLTSMNQVPSIGVINYIIAPPKKKRVSRMVVR
jgi:hypothetical protein